MALVTTMGSKTANSYCTVEEADEYIAAQWPDDTVWADLEDEERENLLLLACLAMQNLIWLGWPVYENQALALPVWDYDEEDFDEDTVSIPDNVKKAQALIAYDVIYRGLKNRTSPDSGPATDAIKGFALFGDISVNFGSAAETPLTTGFNLAGLLRAGHPEIYLLLSPYVSEIGMVRDWTEQAPDLLDEIA